MNRLSQTVHNDHGTDRSIQRRSPGRALRIGITIGLRSEDESLWVNGIKQNALFLAKLLQGSTLKHQVSLLNTTNVAITDSLAWDLGRFDTKPFEDGFEGLDVLIELGGQINADQTRAIKRQGTKLVSYCCGPEYVQNMEAIIFDKSLYDNIFINPSYDCLWIIPQIFDLNRGFLQTFRRCPVRKVPFVWDPMALDAVTAHLPHRGQYRPGAAAKRLSIIEPNIDVLKFCLYPILIAELAFRTNPGDIAFLHVANADRFVHANKEFSALMRKLDIVVAQKASFIGRVITPLFLAEHTDIVISHQWGLPLNYFYLECCWQGYPLIHNADFIPELGYYYNGHDLLQGAECLAKALSEHDLSWHSWRQTQRQLIWRFHAENAALAAVYDDLLFELTSIDP